MKTIKGIQTSEQVARFRIKPVRKSHVAFNWDRGADEKKNRPSVAVPRANVLKYMHFNTTFRCRKSLIASALQ